jgi:hypothetical protein
MWQNVHRCRNQHKPLQTCIALMRKPSVCRARQASGIGRLDQRSRLEIVREEKSGMSTVPVNDSARYR